MSTPATTRADRIVVVDDDAEVALVTVAGEVDLADDA